MTAQEPSAAADRLIAFLVGPDWEDAVIGDLREQHANTNGNQCSYWLSALRSLPGAFRLAVSSWNPPRILFEIGLICALGLAFWVWELQVAQRFAWPLTAEILAISPASVSITCKSVYVGLFAAGTAFAILAVRSSTYAFRPSQRTQTLRTLTLLMASASVVAVYLIEPGPNDGDPAFRFAQLAILVGLAALMRTPSRQSRSFG